MSLVTEQHSMRNPRAVLHWYDFLCPFCYIGQSRNAVLMQHGFHLVELTFQRFTPSEVPGAGQTVEFVDEITVVAAGVQVQCQFYCGD
jgi:hypothetical protein